MRELRLAQVLRPEPARDRIFFHAVWFRDYNNRRYEELLARLARIDAYLLVCSEHRILRGLQFRAYRKTEKRRNAFLLPRIAKKYSGLLTVDPNQARYFDGPVVVDMDDPLFSTREVDLIGRDNVVAYVVTGEEAARRYEALGLSKPHAVVPQGVDLDTVLPARVEEVRSQHRRAGDFVVGYVAAWLLSAGDRGGDNPLYNVDHLLRELWPSIREQVPEARLWLVGGASAQVEQMCAGRSDIVLLGRRPTGDVLNHIAAFDVALYPRRMTHTIRAVKLAEYMGVGVPTVSYDLEIARDLTASGGGMLAATPGEFAGAVAKLAHDPGLRRTMGAAARAYAAGWRWSVLAEQYAGLLDRYLPA